MSRWERLFCAVNPKVERLNNQGLSPTHLTWTSRPRGWLWSSPWLENHVWWKLPRPVAPPPGPQVPESRVDRLAKKVHGQHKPTVRGCRLQVTHALSFPAHWPEMATCPHQGARCLVSVRKHVDLQRQWSSLIHFLWPGSQGLSNISSFISHFHLHGVLLESLSAYMTNGWNFFLMTGVEKENWKQGQSELIQSLKHTTL